MYKILLVDDEILVRDAIIVELRAVQKVRKCPDLPAKWEMQK